MTTSALPTAKSRLRMVLILGAAALVLVIAISDTWPKHNNASIKEAFRFTPGMPGAASLTLAANQPVGALLVNAAEFPRPGYIVVQEEMYGSSGIIVGVSPYIESGRMENVTIELTRAFSGTEQFYVSVRADNGDGRFKQIDDVVMTDVEGNPAAATVALQGVGAQEPFGVALPDSVKTQ